MDARLHTQQHQVLTCGVGEYGRLGQGHSSDVNVFEPITYLEDEEVPTRRVCCVCTFVCLVKGQGRIVSHHHVLVCYSNRVVA